MAHARGVRVSRTGAWVASATALLLLSFSHVAHAQSVPPPATYNPIDSNGVNLISRALVLQSPAASVGQVGAGGLVYQRTYDSSVQSWRDNVTGTINSSGSTYTVTLLGMSETFTLSGGAYTSSERVGGTLTLSGGVFTYRTNGGVEALYSQSLASSQPTQANEGRVTQMTMPSGERLTFTYTELKVQALPNPPTFLAHRLQSVNNNLGYQLSFEYTSNTADASGLQLKKVTAINNAVEFCAPTANGCTLSNTWTSLTFGYGSGYETVTDALSRTMRYSISSNRITGVRRPSSSSDNITITYGASGEVVSISNGVGSWNYAYADSGGSRQTTVTDPLGHTVEYVSDLSIGRVTGYQNGVGDVWTTGWDPYGRPYMEVRPQLGYTRRYLDGRGNVTKVEVIGNYGPSPTAITVTTASYAPTCTNPVTCNQPITTADALGNTTDYTYDSTHGGILTVTAPDPDGASPLPRPQTRYTYSQVTASYIQSSGGAPTPASTSVWRLTEISSCATSSWTGSACAAGVADETRTTITYGTDNKLPTVVSTGAVSGGPTSSVSASYDHVGNVAQVDGPLAAADVTYFRYDAARQRIGVIGPDPDGSGTLKHRALQITYNLDAQITEVERGTVNAPPSPNWPTFTSLERLSIAYDSIGRPTRESVVIGGATYALTQYGYDNANRLDCTAVRMNPAVYGSLPTSACTLSTQGANGPDRITHNIYDSADRLTEVQNSYGTSLQQVTMAQTFRPNGMIQTLTDANGNLTTYEYDDIDRLTRTRFPNASGGGSSTTDYEQLTYNNNSVVTQRRLRDGGLVNLTYDNLARVTQVDAPTGTRDITLTYDNFGRLLSQDFVSTPTFALSFSYDQLSRLLSSTRNADGATHTVSYQYDNAGRRTRVTWPGSPTFYAQYDYDLTGAVTAIRENGAASGDGVLAEFDYDNLGRRIALHRADNAGTTTTYSYDAASRLSSLQQDIAGTSNDPNFSFTYNAAGQALSRTSNAAYDWPQPSISSANYTSNGRNQYTSVGANSFGYDPRGNLTSTGSASYGYDAFNRLTSAGSATLSYDPAGRLHQTTSDGSNVTARFLYDGVDVIAEYDSSNTLMRRFVHGPGDDEPLVEYVGSGTSDPRWLITDQLRSVIAVTDEDGVQIGSPNTYDEYGVPASGNTGRFQYTGQMWISEAGLYHYKARAYIPTIGRFAQTDPILYAGGMNLYTCVANDPINFVDPLGLDGGVITVTATKRALTPEELSVGLASAGQWGSHWDSLAALRGGRPGTHGKQDRNEKDKDDDYRAQCLASLDQAANDVWHGTRWMTVGGYSIAGGAILNAAAPGAPFGYIFLYAEGAAFIRSGHDQYQRGAQVLEANGLTNYVEQVRDSAVASLVPPNNIIQQPPLPSQLPNAGDFCPTPMS